MKSVYKSYLIIGLTVLVVILLVIIILLVLNRPTFSFFNSNDKKGTQEENNKNSSNVDNDANNNSTIIQDSNNSNTNTDVNTNLTPDAGISNDKSNQSDIVNSNQSGENLPTSTTEEVVITYFQNEENKFSNYTNQDDSSLREKAKNSFITIVDFIFYGKDIKGYTFEGLTNSAKLQIIKIALTIDNKIDEYFPNYKTIMKDKYDDIKGQLAVKYLEITSSLCEKVGVDICNQAKDDFNNMKESFGFTWSLIKELAKSGKNKVKDYYENEFRNN